MTAYRNAAMEFETAAEAQMAAADIMALPRTLPVVVVAGPATPGGPKPYPQCTRP